LSETNVPVTFDQLSLSDGVLRALQEAGFAAPTEIQAQAIPAALSGRDLIGRSHTGTGKTLAFGIPAVEACLKKPNSKTTQALVLCPTRELAMQVCDEIRRLTRYLEGVRTVCVYGGQPIQNQIPRLRHGAEIVIGTPGRVMDHIHRHTLRLEDVSMVVLDEADEMLDMGFREDIESILSFVPGEHQTLLFSATMPQAILDITSQFQTNPLMIETSSDDVRTIDTVRQYYYEVPLGKKSDALGLLLHTHEPKLAVIFCNTKKMVEELGCYLSEHGFHCSCLHGDLKQEARTAVMNAFKSGRTPILIATDVAARGIDVDDIDTVYNYDIPQDYEFYIHRIGRTGRAGKDGVSYTLAAGRRQIGQLREISRFTGAKIERLSLPNIQEISQKKRDGLLEEIRAQLEKSDSAESSEMIARLMQEGCSAEHLANVLLELLIRREMDDVPELHLPKSNGKQQGSPLPPVPSGYVRLRFSVGRYQRVAPNHIIAAIADTTRIPGKMIQKIYCYGEYSLVEVPSKFKNLIIKKVNGIKIGGHKTDVRVYEPGDTTAEKEGKKTSAGVKRHAERSGEKRSSSRSSKSGKTHSVPRNADKRSEKKTHVRSGAESKAHLTSENHRKSSSRNRFKRNGKRKSNPTAH
jgi:ATP-dependent RNA helicase DeaD